MTLPQYSKKDFTLVLSPTFSRARFDKPSDVYDVFTNMITRDPKYFYCFWGCYGDPLPEDTTVTEYVEVGGKKYAKTKFTVVKGYEYTKLEKATDSTIYHLPESTFGENGLQPQEVNIKTYATGQDPTSAIQSSTKVIPGTFDKDKDIDNRAYAISASTIVDISGGKTYSFAIIELPPNIPVLWTDNNRLGINVFIYDDEGYKDYRPEKYKYIMGNSMVF